MSELDPMHPVAKGPLVSAEWADTNVDTYLDRCQVDTPPSLVEATWERILRRRGAFAKVLDFGAGDGRFAHAGRYGQYRGYELDWSRVGYPPLPQNATLVHGCAFSATESPADLCIGNPPFVRNQDLPAGWREKVAGKLEERAGVKMSGLANAWQYFFLLSLISTADDGICALVIPFEWVSRPSAKAIRDYIAAHSWDVDVYRLEDEAFAGVMTTASITVIDKRGSGVWRFFDTDSDMQDRAKRSATQTDEGHIGYATRRRAGTFRAVRGLSPGNQKIFVLTEAERARLGLRIDVDVVRCLTSLKDLPADAEELTHQVFDRSIRAGGKRCWLIIPDAAKCPGPLKDYIDSVDPKLYATATCLERELWWRFKMPDVPSVLVASCFKGERPKAVRNLVGAIAVGGVVGIHGGDETMADEFMAHLAQQDLSRRIVAHANGLMKIEIGQFNTLMSEWGCRGTE